MKTTVEAFTAVLPWYERADFQRIWELAHDREDMPADYDVWHAAALKVINGSVPRGRALQIVTIRPDEFLAWLEARGLPNTAATRLKYVECKATEGGSTPGGAGKPSQREAMLARGGQEQTDQTSQR